MDELGRWMSAHSSIFIHLLSEICSSILRWMSSLVDCSLIHLKMDLSRRRCSLIHLRCAAVQWQILIFSPSGCPEPDSVAKPRGHVADCLAASSLSRSWCVKASTNCNRAQPPTGRSLLAPPLADNSSLALRLTPGLLSPRSALAVVTGERGPAEERQEQQGPGQ